MKRLCSRHISARRGKKAKIGKAKTARDFWFGSRFVFASGWQQVQLYLASYAKSGGFVDTPAACFAAAHARSSGPSELREVTRGYAPLFLYPCARASPPTPAREPPARHCPFSMVNAPTAQCSCSLLANFSFWCAFATGCSNGLAPPPAVAPHVLLPAGSPQAVSPPPTSNQSKDTSRS